MAQRMLGHILREAVEFLEKEMAEIRQEPLEDGELIADQDALIAAVQRDIRTINLAWEAIENGHTVRIVEVAGCS